MRTIKNLKEQFLSDLDGEFPVDELKSMFARLVRKHLNISDNFAEQENRELDNLVIQKFDDALARLKRNEPIEYIVGEAEFFGRKFKVNSDVHVPRPETETLVRWVLEDFPQLQQQSGSSLSLLDIGTGSGLLPITLGKELPLQVTAVDISEKALDVARENAALNDAQVNYIQDDVLTWKELPKKFDIVVSNPPYILEKARTDIQRKILEHEPSIALYVKDEDPVIFNRKIAELARESLTQNGIVYVEINQFLGAETAKVFADNGFKTEIRKDIFGNNRTIKAFRD